MSTHTPGLKITFDGFGFNDAGDPYKRRLSTLPATWKDEGERQQFGHEVVRAVNTHAKLLEALKEVNAFYDDPLRCSGPLQDVLRTVRDAIAAAEGKD